MDAAAAVGEGRRRRVMMLVVVHSHFRPGGVRRVIELGLAAFTSARRSPPGLEELLLLGGEAPDRAWLGQLTRRIDPVRVRWVANRHLGYVAEQRSTTAARRSQVRRILARWLDVRPAEDLIIWLHNPGLARNPDLVHEVARWCEHRGVRLICHHHDWWFDHRWARWPELTAAGRHSLRTISPIVLPVGDAIRHATINRSDATVVARHFPRRSAWLPNPVAPDLRVPGARARRAGSWLARRSGHRGPVWILPARLLRRKNLAEALLVMRWVRPEACLVTTGGVSSADEQPYADALRAAAESHGWPLQLGVLAHAANDGPAVEDLLAASEAVLLTSLIEGFGLPFVEAAAARRPLIARSLPNVAPDLTRFGFRFPHTYPEVRIDPVLFDWDAERARQADRFARWRARLPREVRHWAGEPEILSGGSHERPIAFSRLTLIAQLEVLGVPPEWSWPLCATWNPTLAGCRKAVAGTGLSATRWPAEATRWLGDAAYARRFARLAAPTRSPHVRADAGSLAQSELVRMKLAASHQYPLLWTPEP